MINKIIFYLFLLLFSITANTDDIEVFVGNNKVANPNILMIMDTSESMNRISHLDNEKLIAYNPDIIYPTYFYEFDPSGIYLFRFDEDSTENSNNNLRFKNGIIDKIKYFKIHPDSVQCEPARNIHRQGVYKGKIRYYFYENNRVPLRYASWTAPSNQAELLESKGAQLSETDDRNIADCELDNDNKPTKGSGIFKKYRNLKPVNRPSVIRKEPYIWTYTKEGMPGLTTANWNNGIYYSHIFSGNYLNYLAQPYAIGIDKTRLQVLTNASVEVMHSVDNVNFSIMRFDQGPENNNSAGSEGGYVSIPMQPINIMRQRAAAKLRNFKAKGSTPISETLYESYQYLRGSHIKYGLTSQPELSHESTMNWHKYIAPKVESCSTNRVILFSDGEPDADSSADAEIIDLFNSTKTPRPVGLGSYCKTRKQDRLDTCADELSYAMSNLDFHKDLPDTQTVSINTIGGFLDDDSLGAKQSLINIAHHGDGAFYSVNDYSSLVSAIKQSMITIDSSLATLSAPGITYASDTQLDIGDEIYYTVFEPSASPGWRGNLKRYRLSDKGMIVGQDGKPAITNGKTLETAVSFWSDKIKGQFQADGNKVGRGGVANQRDHHRRLFTQSTSHQTIQLVQNKKAKETGTLSDIITDQIRSYLTPELLGVSNLSGDQLDIIRAWILGYNADKSWRLEIEDSLHSRPVKFNYSKNKSSLFFMTNSGYLHAIDPQSGKEIFSFLPRELLKNPAIYMNPERDQSGRKRYGLDGNISVWREDLNQDGIINKADRAILYFGMRRGGHSYYALDISDRQTPKLLWQINGNYMEAHRVNKPPVTNGYSKLGQTWSTLIPAEIQWQGKTKVVLIASGGYDPVEDGNGLTGPNSRIKHTRGNSIYIIDALTGKRLFDASVHKNNRQMTSSFAADPVPIDLTGNGKIDRIYAADVGGRIWRLDLNAQHKNSDSASDLVSKVQVLADINSGAGKGNRRFFNRPDVSLNSHLGHKPITISIGSGYRAHPLSSKVDDYHYVILDSVVNQPLGRPLQHDELANWGSIRHSAMPNKTSAVTGWKVKFPQAGEKALSSSVTFQGKINFVTYRVKNREGCHGERGNNTYYTLDLNQAFKKKRSLTQSQLAVEGIAPTPIIFTHKIDDKTDDTDPGPMDDIGTRNCAAQKSAILIGEETVTHNMEPCSLFDWGYWKEIF